MGEASRIAEAAANGISQPHVNPQLVSILESMLSQVRQGQINSVMIVCVSPLGNIGTAAAGMQMADIYVGADMFKSAMLESMKRPSSPIIKAQ